MRKKSKKQFFWEFMRRHKKFRVGDAMIALDLSKRYVKQMLWQLEGAGYVKIVSDPGRFEDRIYLLVKDTGILSPVLINGKVMDKNRNFAKKVQKKIKIPKHPPRRQIPTALKLLNAIRSRVVTKVQICNIAGVNPYSGSAKRAFREFEEKGVLKPIEPIRRIDGHKAFYVDILKKDELRREITKKLEVLKIGAARREDD